MKSMVVALSQFQSVMNRAPMRLDGALGQLGQLGQVYLFFDRRRFLFETFEMRP